MANPLKKKATYASITAGLSKMVDDLTALEAAKRDERNAHLDAAERSQALANAAATEADKASNTAAKIADLLS